MDEPTIPESPDQFRDELVRLRETRRTRHRTASRRRQSLAPAVREAVLRKTANRCHVCGGSISARWEVDHVLAHAGGGRHSVENYLAAHPVCNNYRWDYEPEEFQWVLKIGVWARLQMEKGGPVGESMLASFVKSQRSVQRRRRPRKPAA